MRAWLIGVMLFLWAGHATAQSEPAIEDVITQQLQAFNDRDIETAWTFASPMIQGMFGTAGRFGTMVQQGYPMVWDNSEAAFLEAEPMGGQIIQKVFVRDPTGAGWVLSYAMIQTPDGWKINGVSIEPAPELAA